VTKKPLIMVKTSQSRTSGSSGQGARFASLHSADRANTGVAGLCNVDRRHAFLLLCAGFASFPRRLVAREMHRGDHV